MTNSRSKSFRSNVLRFAVVLCVVVGSVTSAYADRKRVVVLDLDGPSGAKFHAELVKLIKKTHTVVPIGKWNGVAEELSAADSSEKSLRKVARKLKVDAIVEGKIEKRRDEYIIRLKLREGKSGEVIGDSIDTKAEGTRIEGRAQKDLRSELVDAIDNVKSNRSGGGSTMEDEEPRLANAEADEAEDDKPAKKGKKGKKAAEDDEEVVDEDDEDKPDKKGFSRSSGDERGEDRVGFGKKSRLDDETSKADAKKAAQQAKLEEEAAAKAAKEAAAKQAAEKDAAAKEAAKKKSEVARDDEDRDDRKSRKDKRTAARRGSDDDDDDSDASAEASGERSGPIDAATALSPGERAVDAVVGLSLTTRRLTFNARANLLARPPKYASRTPAAGGMIDATIYPLAYGHKRSDLLKNIGLNVMYDRVFKLSSKDPTTGMVYTSSESRWAVNGVFRYSFSRTPTSLVVGGTFGYSSQTFSIATGLPNSVPSVKYSMFQPGGFVRYPVPVLPKLTVGLDLKAILATNTGEIQQPTQYGTATVFGYDAIVGVDYLVTRNIFARAQFRYESINYDFRGNGEQSNNRDGDPATQDVMSATDMYVGGTLTAGYLF